MILEFGKDNKIDFTVLIDGFTSDISLRPTVRFAIEEDKTGFSWCFSANKKGHGKYSVIIPNFSCFRENNTYRGYIEVLMRDYYFVPAETPINFIDAELLEESNVASKAVATDKPEAFVKKRQNISRPMAEVINKKTKNRPRVVATLVSKR